MNKANDPLLIDDISRPPLAIDFFEAAVIGDQGKTDTMFFSKIMVSLE